MVTHQRVVDLLPQSGHTKQATTLNHYYDRDLDCILSRINGLNDRIILTLEDFFVAVADAFRCRKELSLGTEYRDKDLRKKSHFVINLALIQQVASKQFRQLAQLNFVELSGSEQAINMGKDGSSEFISQSFNSLSCHLVQTVLRKRSKTPVKNDSQAESKLVQCLSQTLT